MDEMRKQVEEITDEMRSQMEEITNEMTSQIRSITKDLLEEVGVTVLSQRSARVLVQWVVNHGHTKEEAYELLALTLGAAAD